MFALSVGEKIDFGMDGWIVMNNVNLQQPLHACNANLVLASS
jgi:hypothetical protein